MFLSFLNRIDSRLCHHYDGLFGEKMLLNKELKVFHMDII